MAQRWSLTGLEPTDPIYLYVETDDDGLIVQLQQPIYRSADVIITNLVAGWEEYSEVKTIDVFKEYITEMYGSQVYMVRRIG